MLSMNVDVSIIIVNYNGQELLPLCFSSIYEMDHRVSKEVIFVDNASVDDSVSYMRDHFPDVKIIENDQNLGFTRANNQGIEISSGKYVVLLNNDTEVKNEAFSNAFDYMEANPDVGICGYKLLNRDGSIQYSCRSFPRFETALFNRYSLLTRLFPNNPISRNYLSSDFTHDRVMEFDWVSGAAMMIRRSLYEDSFFLDEDFFMYSEDVDICYRAWEKGSKVVFFPDSVIVHYIGHTTKKHKKLRIPTLWYRHQSMYIFYKKHYSRHFFLLDFMTGFAILARFILYCIQIFFRGGHA